MKVKTIIIDDFYSNPDTVREFALSQKFEVSGNYPGLRTVPFLTEDTKSHSRCSAFFWNCTLSP